MGNIKCKAIWNKLVSGTNPSASKWVTSQTSQERLKPLLRAQHVGGLSSPATQIPTQLSQPSLLSPQVPKAACPSQNTTFCYPLSSLPICPPRQLGWAWVGASTGLAHGRGPVHWLLCRLNGDHPACCECSGK